MKTVQVTLDEDLVREVDNVARKLHTTISAFTRDALRNAIKNLHIMQLERKHINGYKDKPTDINDVEIWEEEQDWGK